MTKFPDMFDKFYFLENYLIFFINNKRMIPILGCSLEIGKLDDFILNSNKKYGDIFTLGLFGFRIQRIMNKKFSK